MTRSPSSSETPDGPRTIPFAPRAAAFAVTWITYFTYYLGRKGVGVVRTSIVDDLGARSLYGVETGLLAAYACGQYLSGFLGDRVGARRLLVFGLLASAGACVVFGASHAWVFLFSAYVANGCAQSTGWPGTTKAMAEWTTPADRGRVMGLWSTCYQLGGAGATVVCAHLAHAYGWRWAFFGPAIGLAAIALLVRLALEKGPSAPSRGQEPRDVDAGLAATRRREQLRVLRSPTIYSYGLSYFSIKLVRYSLLFWLNWYLERSLGYDQVRAANVSIAFEVGGFFGTVTLGYLSDRYRALPRSLFAIVSLALLGGALLLYSEAAGSSVATNVLLLALIGFLLFGPDALISGTAAQDAGGPYAAAFAAGMVNGIGSLGAIFQELVTRTVSARYGWPAVFHVFVGLALAASVCLLPSLRRRLPEAPASL